MLAFIAHVESWTQEDYERVFGTPEEQAKELRILARNESFVRLPAIRDKYMGRWVCVFDCKVLADAATYEELRGIISASSDIGRVRYLIRHIQPDPVRVETPGLFALKALVANWSPEDVDRIMNSDGERKALEREMHNDEEFLRRASVEQAYPGRWVAAHGCSVLAHAGSWEDLRAILNTPTFMGTQFAVRQMPAR